MDPKDIEAPHDPLSPTVAGVAADGSKVGGPGARFATEQHAATAKFLYDASVSGRLGSGPVEPDIKNSSVLVLILKTIPWTILILQFIWSGAVLGIAYALRPTEQDGSDTFSSLSTDFWTSKLNVSSNIAYGVGWALFVLLGFFVREANGRYKEAQFAIEKAMGATRQVYRQLRQIYPPGSCHPGDIERIGAHVVALPIALKMTLRGEREREQLQHILHPDDVTDVLDTELMYLQCTRVLRAYAFSTEEDAGFSFQYSAVTASVKCWCSRALMGFMVDVVDDACNAAVRIAHFHPSVGYVSHLSNFLYIWSFFLPLVLVQTSGWFTPLWSIIITYCVGMLFSIAKALNEPFGFDIQDIKLNRICADWGYQMLWEHSACKYLMEENILPDHETPAWLEKLPDKHDPESVKKKARIRRRMMKAYQKVSRNLGNVFVFRNLALFVAWLSFIVFLTWGLTKDKEVPRAPSDRWWTIYLPISTTTTGFISLGVFLLLGFWMNDAYSRYWRCLQLLNSNIKPGIEHLAFILSFMTGHDYWHPRDRERLLSFFVAFAYSVKLHLRQSRDVSELEGVLDARDLQALAQAPHLPNHCLNVLFGYCNSAECFDRKTVQHDELKVGMMAGVFEYKISVIESAITECDSTRKYPMSLAFTVHLFVYVTFWLAILPLSLVQANGFLVFLFITPVAYAIINLLNIGTNLSDPFGFDHEDIPMDNICDEIKNNIHHMYHESADSYEGYIHEEPYDRAKFTPILQRSDESSCSDEQDDASVEKAKLMAKPSAEDSGGELTVLCLLRSAWGKLPQVSPVAQLAATVWSIIAVFASWGMSKLSDEWRTGLRGGCQEWCSPIDVDGETLANIGYALFMLLAFRASDALGRYEDGAELVYEVKLQLHTSAVEFIHCFRQDYIHKNDRERYIAHLVQLPFLIRDRLLDGPNFNPVSDDSILSPNDQRRLADSAEPFEHVLRTLESYVMLMDIGNRKPFTTEPLQIFTLGIYYMSEHFYVLRQVYANMLSVKNFPVISRYSNHQYVFTALWLGLLPLYMTEQTGFFTILWAPLISYGVFALQAIAEKLVDPFGEDSIDIPIRKLMTETAEEILATVEAHDWDCVAYARASPQEARPTLGFQFVNGDVDAKRHLAHFEEHEATVENFGKSPIVEFKSSDSAKRKPNLLAHLVNSVPWWAVVSIVAWTAVGCVISYVSRDKTVTNVRWWKSGISVSTNVATYVSFAAFTLLGFYVQAAFKRYTQAGVVWGDNLHTACHAFAVLGLNLMDNGSVHERDQDRMIGHIAAIPLVLKLELRNSRDLRELRGLLSFEDIARLQSAHSMTTHCVDVLLSYVYTIVHHPDRMVTDVGPIGNRMLILCPEMSGLRNALRSARFLNEFDIAPGFIVLLNSLLAIWFLFLPFVLAEISGWFTILWVAIIAYGVLGMYNVAAELQSPFGTDVNDLDLDKMADFIVRDILFIQKNYKAGTKVLTRPSQPVELWQSETVVNKKHLAVDVDGDGSKLQRFKTMIELAAQSVPPLQLAFNAVWAAVCVALAYGTSKWFAIDDGVCESSWFCTYIAIDSSLGGFIGFALFLLLGFRLYDSHARYVMAVRLWRDNMVGSSRTLATRVLSAMPPGTFHEGDIDRIIGHIAAFAICTMGALRGKDYEDRLATVVSAEDVARILSARERIDYCLDVVRAYAMEGTRSLTTNPPHAIGSYENSIWQQVVHTLSKSAYECRRLVLVPLPFGYVQHLHIFLYIWLLLLPLGLVESTGWLTILWVVIIAYGVFGVEHWSAELADPFGYDLSDVPLDDMCDEIIAELKAVHTLIKGKGLGVWIHPDRLGMAGNVMRATETKLVS